jgi:putative two-component system response regulator
VAGETILLVEDSQILREGLHALLEQERYRVLTAVHGLDALGQMKDNLPDLILSDIVMPEMDGYAFFEAVRQNPEWISIPFIFLTARRERQSVLAGKKLGADDYLLKPVSPDELLIVIRARLVRTQEIRLVQIQESYEASLSVLANAIEVRDPYTRGHIERVRDYALAIAEELGWPRSNLNHLRFGSILHDIGKINISEQILNKNAPLEPSEWAEMEKHPSLGVDLIKEIPYLAQTIPVILYHHERWDGDGYPFGLQGEEIPEGARITAVADSFDAMTRVRPYRRPLTPDQAQTEIVTCSGQKYDPAVVEAFQRAWDAGRIQAIFDQYP